MPAQAVIPLKVDRGSTIPFLLRVRIKGGLAHRAFPTAAHPGRLDGERFALYVWPDTTVSDLVQHVHDAANADAERHPVEGCGVGPGARLGLRVLFPHTGEPPWNAMDLGTVSVAHSAGEPLAAQTVAAAGIRPGDVLDVLVRSA